MFEKSDFFAFQDNFYVYISVKQYSLECHDWEANEHKERTSFFKSFMLLFLSKQIIQSDQALPHRSAGPWLHLDV